jgi:5'(3')-deoxyribonucleotidase
MRIAFDVDGVVLKSIDIILDYINMKEGRDLRADSLTSWELEPMGLDLETLREAVDHMYTHASIKPYIGAVDVLSRIHRITGAPLLFITGRADPETAQRQLEALPWNPTVPAMIVRGGDRDKRNYLVENAVDFIVEDDVRYLKDYLEAGFGVGLMVRPWNRDSGIEVTERFRSWTDVEQWFLNVWRKS